MPGFDQPSRARLARDLKAEAIRLGFLACGLSLAQRLDEEAEQLEGWLKAGRHGTMDWMAGHFEKRVDPRRLVDGAKTVVSVLHNYYPAREARQDQAVGRISRYAWGDDYHDVVKERLAELFFWLDRRCAGVGGRAFVDSAPVLDKVWAQRSGLGWIGKHTNVIRQGAGSYFFIGELIVDIELPPDAAAFDHCGSCTRCIDACPTGAIDAPYQLDAERCISYLTIEHRADDIDPGLAKGMGNWIFGCDICQEVCPWTKFSTPTSEVRYSPRPGIADTSLQEWSELDLEGFRELFRRNPVKRTKFEGFQRNVRLAMGNRGRTD